MAARLSPSPPALESLPTNRGVTPDTMVLARRSSDRASDENESPEDRQGDVVQRLAKTVEQQRTRIRELVMAAEKRDAATQELKGLFEQLTRDYEEASQRAQSSALSLSALQAHTSAVEEELDLTKAASAMQQEKIQHFNDEWAAKTEHLRRQFAMVVEEKNAAEAQRDELLEGHRVLRRESERLHRELEELRQSLEARVKRGVDDKTAAQEQAHKDRDARLREREEAVERESRRIDEGMYRVSQDNTAARENRDILQWRLSQMEGVVRAKEQLQQQLTTTADGLREQLAKTERAAQAEQALHEKRLRDLSESYQTQLTELQRLHDQLKREAAQAAKTARVAQDRLEKQLDDAEERHRTALEERDRRDAQSTRALRSLREELETTKTELGVAQAASHRLSRQAQDNNASQLHAQETEQALREALTVAERRAATEQRRAALLLHRLEEKEKETEAYRCTLERGMWLRALAWSEETGQALLEAAQDLHDRDGRGHTQQHHSIRQPLAAITAGDDAESAPKSRARRVQLAVVPEDNDADSPTAASAASAAAPDGGVCEPGGSGLAGISVLSIHRGTGTEDDTRNAIRDASDDDESDAEDDEFSAFFDDELLRRCAAREGSRTREPRAASTVASAAAARTAPTPLHTRAAPRPVSTASAVSTPPRRGSQSRSHSTTHGLNRSPFQRAQRRGPWPSASSPSPFRRADDRPRAVTAANHSTHQQQQQQQQTFARDEADKAQMSSRVHASAQQHPFSLPSPDSAWSPSGLRSPWSPPMPSATPSRHEARTHGDASDSGQPPRRVADANAGVSSSPYRATPPLAPPSARTQTAPPAASHRTQQQQHQPQQPTGSAPRPSQEDKAPPQQPHAVTRSDPNQSMGSARYYQDDNDEEDVVARGVVDPAARSERSWPSSTEDRQRQRRGRDGLWGDAYMDPQSLIHAAVEEVLWRTRHQQQQPQQPPPPPPPLAGRLFVSASNTSVEASERGPLDATTHATTTATTHNDKDNGTASLVSGFVPPPRLHGKLGVAPQRDDDNDDDDESSMAPSSMVVASQQKEREEGEAEEEVRGVLRGGHARAPSSVRSDTPLSDVLHAQDAAHSEAAASGRVETALASVEPMLRAWEATRTASDRYVQSTLDELVERQKRLLSSVRDGDTGSPSRAVREKPRGAGDPLQTSRTPDHHHHHQHHKSHKRSSGAATTPSRTSAANKTTTATTTTTTTTTPASAVRKGAHHAGELGVSSATVLSSMDTHDANEALFAAYEPSRRPDGSAMRTPPRPTRAAPNTTAGAARDVHDQGEVSPLTVDVLQRHFSETFRLPIP